ncbi:hypothetical protein BDM02DRAFT_2453879 [Thelephora ganbajun]|uniref:Uncharacterized protein n=1 Tax=Thelephora ganbajun TaxID=370292 RepID=A0ACB6ZEQ9_THEGA|nr:hypothetical protein BDM02DRAFT_2453879 [Thelephora ganbajun]
MVRATARITVKGVFKKSKTKEHAAPRIRNGTPPRWRILPPEIIHIIVNLLKHDKRTLRACSLAAREFSQAALSCIGQHITVNHVPRIKQCMKLLTVHSAFQHVRSLDLGVTSKSSNSKDHLEEQLAILEIFAQRQTLTCLWLSNVPFPSIEPSQRGKIRDIVTALGSTVNNLGLYGCRFSSYTDMISFIRAFPRCDTLYIRDCVTGGKDSTESTFSGLPEHKLSLGVLELTSASSNGLIADVSSSIENATLDISRLSALTCSVESTEQAQCVATAASASPIQHFQLTCTEPGGFQAFLNPMKKWPLESLTIGPISHATDRAYWHDAFQNFQTVPRLKELTIIYYYPNLNTFDVNCWGYFDSLFCRRDIFPRLRQVNIRITIQSSPPNRKQEEALLSTLYSIRRFLRVTFWGKRE